MSQSTPGVLERILARTRERVFEQRRVFPLERMQRSAPTPSGRRPFLPAIARPGQINVIAEFKRRSPSRGVIREDLHPMQVAQAYEVGGAAALSVLTEEQFFGGSLEDLKDARAATLLPALRKDFVVDPYQVWEAWYAGADAVLLIVAALEQRALTRLQQRAHDLGLAALVEVHNEEELDRAIDSGARLIGVNNRNLRTLTVDVEASYRLAERIPAGAVGVSESGLQTRADLEQLAAAGYRGFLIGERFMTDSDPASAVRELITGVGRTLSGSPSRT
jgi:indole-3-glycerol phosphate synthase